MDQLEIQAKINRYKLRSQYLYEFKSAYNIAIWDWFRQGFATPDEVSDILRRHGKKIDAEVREIQVEIQQLQLEKQSEGT